MFPGCSLAEEQNINEIKYFFLNQNFKNLIFGFFYTTHLLIFKEIINHYTRFKIIFMKF